MEFWIKTQKPFAAYGKFSEKSMGKDSTIGHWEIAGIESEKPLPIYENGFAEEIINELQHNKIYEYCQIAREILTKEHGVGRVVARPFYGK